MGCCTETAEETSVIQKALSLDPVNAPELPDDHERECGRCRGASHAVTQKTMLLMLRPEQFERVGKSEYRFCSVPECRVVYFSEESAVVFVTGDLRVRVGLKERINPVPLCYCFGFDEGDLRDEIIRIGTSTIPQRIATLIKQEMCACPDRNPSGACCLGEVSKAVKRLMNEAVQI